MAILFWIWKTSFYLLLFFQCHLRLKTDKKQFLYIPQKFLCLILESLFRNVYINLNNSLNEKGSQQTLRSAQTDTYFIFLMLAFFSLLLWKWCHLSEEIFNSLFLSSSNRKLYFLSRVSLCNRIGINLKPHYARIICHFTPFKRFMLLKRDWGWSHALQASIQTMGMIWKYPVGRGINKIWCYTLFLLWDYARHHNTVTIFIMFGHSKEIQRMGQYIRAWCCLLPRSRHLNFFWLSAVACCWSFPSTEGWQWP